jgi:predicted dehydrogenase
MAKKTWRAGILGCGDFLRLNVEELRKSERIAVKTLFDPDAARARSYAKQFQAEVVDNAEGILDSPDIDLALLFMPPWARKDAFVRAAEAGKQILTTKPLGPTAADCAAMVRAGEKNKTHSGVMYNRTANSVVQSLRKLFDGGKIGRLGLFKQDWIHHYPQWNAWALDPTKNGGPFMDAMIHNLNIARYLMARPAVQATFFGDSHAHELTCNDTEFLKLDFAGRGAAHLFITWAADLGVQSTEGNYREHIDLLYLVTDKGWRVTLEGGQIVASRDGKNQNFPVEPIRGTVYDRFLETVEAGKANPADIPTVREAFEDIRIIRDASASPGRQVAIDLSLP